MAMSKMKIPFSGGCVCGAVRYECSAEPIMMFKCHCSDCQRLTGGEFDERPTGMIGVTVGSLDDPTWFHPQMDVFVSDAQPWDQMDSAIPKFEHYPSPAKG
jgi:hypothetical protein